MPKFIPKIVNLVVVSLKRPMKIKKKWFCFNDRQPSATISIEVDLSEIRKKNFLLNVLFVVGKIQWLLLIIQ